MKKQKPANDISLKRVLILTHVVFIFLTMCTIIVGYLSNPLVDSQINLAYTNAPAAQNDYGITAMIIALTSLVIIYIVSAIFTYIVLYFSKALKYWLFQSNVHEREISFVCGAVLTLLAFGAYVIISTVSNFYTSFTDPMAVQALAETIPAVIVFLVAGSIFAFCVAIIVEKSATFSKFIFQKSKRK